MPTVEIRPASPEDVDGITAVAERGWRAAHGDILDDETIDAVLAEWYDPTTTREAIEADDISYYVATAGEILGYVSGRATGETARLGAIYVDPERWGEGIGTALLVAFESDCVEQGAGAIEFEVLAENETGRRFYEARGYESVDSQEAALFGETVMEMTFRGSLDD